MWQNFYLLVTLFFFGSEMVIILESMFIQVFKGLYENASNSIHVSAHLAILAAVRDICKLAVKELTSWVCSVPHYICLEPSSPSVVIVQFFSCR